MCQAAFGDWLSEKESIEITGLSCKIKNMKNKEKQTDMQLLQSQIGLGGADNQTESSPPVTNEVIKGTDAKSKASGISQEICDAINAMDCSNEIWQLNEHEVEFHNGEQWVDATDEILRKIVLGAVAGAQLTPILVFGAPAMLGFEFSTLDGEGTYEIGDAILDIPSVITSAVSRFDFANRISEFKKYSRKGISEGKEKYLTVKELKSRAKESLEKLFAQKSLHLAAVIAPIPMRENGRNMHGGFIAQRTMEGARLAFVYFGATGNDVPEVAKLRLEM